LIDVSSVLLFEHQTHIHGHVLEHWRSDGVPPNPGGWLATTAWRKAIDRIRRDRADQEKLALLVAAIPLSAGHVNAHGRP
jgi:predicted RNA polymerase sigma factor